MSECRVWIKYGVVLDYTHVLRMCLLYSINLIFSKVQCCLHAGGVTKNIYIAGVWNLELQLRRYLQNNNYGGF